MHRAIWLIPPAVFAGVAALAFVPIQRPDPPPVAIAPPLPPRPPLRPVAAALPVSIPDRELEPAPQPAAAAAPVVAAAAPQTAPRPAQSNPDATLYTREISSLRGSFTFNLNASSELIALGDTTGAQARLDKADRSHKLARCLENQLQRGVPFYNGKATCSVAVSSR
jgi:hypothetical protein